MGTDFDVVTPDNKEKEFIEMALRLNYKHIIFLYKDINYKYDCNAYNNKGVSVKKAYLLKNPSEINLARKRFDLIFAPAERKYFEMKTDYIIGCELSERKDSFHYRATSLNQVHAKLCKQNNSAIVFDFGLLLDKSRRQRAVFFGRMMQNKHLVDKYKLRSAAFSLASSPQGMRSRAILDAVERVV
jgi:RNase P/RNase MRP subunit p30